jgi:hypothetical protein
MPKVSPFLQYVGGFVTTALLVVVAVFAWQSLARISAVEAPELGANPEVPDSYSKGTISSETSGDTTTAAAASVLPAVGGTSSSPGIAPPVAAPRTYSTAYERSLAPSRARLDFEKARIEAGYGIVIRDTVLPVLQTLLVAILAYLFAAPAAAGLADLGAAVRLRAAAQEIDARTRSAARDGSVRT